MLFPEDNPDALFFSMNDVEFCCARNALRPFHLEGEEWPSAEHYYQAMKFIAPDYREKIRLAETTALAVKLGKARFKRKRPDWNAVRTTVMTRAVYTQCRTHADMAAALLDTESQPLVESSQYDYYWGCGRDRRGDNHYGKLLVNVRAKLREQLSGEI